jgi:hypothetical protein
MDVKSVGTVLANAVTIESSLAQAAAPIVGVYNPAAGALLATLAPTLGPLISSFILTETQVIVNLNSGMSRADMIKALQASKSVSWEADAPMPSLNLIVKPT